MRKFNFVLILFLLISISLVDGASIKGTVYDLSLDRVQNVILTIDSVPPQTYVSKDGSYQFELNPGSYTLKAELFQDNVLQSESIETIDITEEGEFIIDLVLFPSIEEIDDEIDLEEPFPEQSTWYYYGIPLIILILILIILRIRKIFFIKKKKNQIVKNMDVQYQKPVQIVQEKSQPPIDQDLNKMVQTIRNNGGRISQKELRQAYPSLSEAKMSLMISELEHKGYIEKIKKGRGNLIWLKRK